MLLLITNWLLSSGSLFPVCTHCSASYWSGKETNNMVSVCFSCGGRWVFSSSHSLQNIFGLRMKYIRRTYLLHRRQKEASQRQDERVFPRVRKQNSAFCWCTQEEVGQKLATLQSSTWVRHSWSGGRDVFMRLRSWQHMTTVWHLSPHRETQRCSKSSFHFVWLYLTRPGTWTHHPLSSLSSDTSSSLAADSPPLSLRVQGRWLSAALHQPPL